jgi:uncharacterized protein
MMWRRTASPLVPTGQTRHDLRAEISDWFCGLTGAEWSRYFPNHPDAFENVALSQSCGMDGIAFRTLAIRDAHSPVLLLPTFEANFRASSMTDGKVRGVVRALEPLAPGWLRPRLLGVGLVEGEWGAVGMRPGLSTDEIDGAWRVAMLELNTLARASRADALVLLEMGPATLARIPGGLLRGFARVRTSPCAQVPLPFRSVDEYLGSLSRSTRQGLRRRIRASRHLRVERVREPGAHLPRILELYRAAIGRAPVVLGVQRAAYFQRVCAEVPGAHYVLYFAGASLLGFNLLIARADMLIDKYFCMEAVEGRRHHLYFVSWMENIRQAIESGCVVYHAGPGAEETKAHLGSRFVRTSTFFRHTNAVAHRALAVLARAVAPDTGVTERAKAGDALPMEAPA